MIEIKAQEHYHTLTLMLLEGRTDLIKVRKELPPSMIADMLFGKSGIVYTPEKDSPAMTPVQRETFYVNNVIYANPSRQLVIDVLIEKGVAHLPVIGYNELT